MLRLAHLLAEGANEGDLTVFLQQLGDNELDGLHEVALLKLLRKLLLLSKPSVCLLTCPTLPYSPVINQIKNDDSIWKMCQQAKTSRRVRETNHFRPADSFP